MSARESYPSDHDFNYDAAMDEIDRLRAAVIMQGLTLQPGDTLIVRMGTRVTSDQAADYRALLIKRLPGLADVVILGAEEIAVYRPDRTETTP